jgi:hypothetical protein
MKGLLVVRDIEEIPARNAPLSSLLFRTSRQLYELSSERPKLRGIRHGESFYRNGGTHADHSFAWCAPSIGMKNSACVYGTAKSRGRHRHRQSRNY